MNDSSQSDRNPAAHLPIPLTGASSLRPLIPALLLLVAGCDNVCRQLYTRDAGVPSVAVVAEVEYAARQAGVSEDDVRTTTEQVLRANGVNVAMSGQETNYSVGIRVRVLNPGALGYVGAIEIAAHEPANLWSNGRAIKAITATENLIFATPQRDLGEYVREQLKDGVRAVLAEDPRLAGN